MIQMANEHRDLSDTIGTWGAVVLLLSALFVALAVVAYQVYGWLRFGTWQEMPFGILFGWLHIDITPVGNMEWQGIKKISLWVLELPLSMVMIALSAMLGFLLADSWKAK